MTAKQPSKLPWLWHDKSGATLVLVALTISALVGFAGLGAESGLWYAMKRHDQSVADAAVMSAAYEILSDRYKSPIVTPTQGTLQTVATESATNNGCTASNNCTATVTYPYSDAIVPSGVSVTVQQTQTTLLASISVTPNVTIVTRAAARVDDVGNPCLLALAPTGTGINNQGNPTLSMPGCVLVADSTSAGAVHVQGSASVTAASIYTPGTLTTNGNPTINLTSPAVTGSLANSVPDPYGPSGTDPFTNTCTGTTDYLSHTFLTTCPNIPSTCSANLANGMNFSGRYCGTQTIKNITVDLVPQVTGAITSITVTAQGKNYTSTPTVTITGGGGSGATAVATVSKNKVTAINITSLGSSYTTAPTVTITGGGGSGATAVASAPQSSNGIFWITDGDLALDAGGTLECTLCNVATGQGVTIIFTTTAGAAGTIGGPTMQGNPTIDNLNAPGSGEYAGLAMVQDTVAGATYTTGCNFQGTPGQTLNGLIYVPHCDLSFQGNPTTGANSCLEVVANTVSLQGNATLTSTGCVSSIVPPPIQKIALAE